MGGFEAAYKKLVTGLRCGPMGPGNGEYVGEDGFVHCSKCGAPRQCYAAMPGGDAILVWCPCMCTESGDMASKAGAVESERRRCFSGDVPDSRFSGYGVEQTPQLMEVKRYAEGFEGYAKRGMGLILAGGTGTGKTFAADCLANYLIDSGFTAFKVNFPRAVLDRDFFDDRNVRLMAESDLLVIDDLGAERDTSYMSERVYAVVDSRYSARRPMVVTTNLGSEQMRNPGDQRSARVYSRVMELCCPVSFTGADRRRSSGISAMKRELQGAC